MTTTFRTAPLSTPVDQDGNSVNREWLSFFGQSSDAMNSLYQYGTTTNRPVKAYFGQFYYDTTISKLLFAVPQQSGTALWFAITSTGPV